VNKTWLIAGLLAAACGGSGGPSAGGKGAAAPKAVRAKPVKEDALRQFDRGLRALKLGGAGADEQAAERFQKAVEIDGTLWEAWHNLGVVKARHGDDKAAVTAFGKALDINPRHAPARLGRAESNRRLRAFKAAKSDYEAVLTNDDDNVEARLRLASLLREAGDGEESQKQVREALRRAPGNAAANVELGLTYLAMNRLELAELVLVKAATSDAKNPQVWNALALVSLKRGKDQEAFARLDKATQADPTFKDARFNKAAVLLDAGDYAQAKSELQTALGDAENDTERLTANDLDALVALGVAYRGMGDHPKAKGTWERVLRVAPMNADALYNLAVLQMDFLREPAPAQSYLERFLDASTAEHPKRKDAEKRLGEVKKGKA
jgi:tetratricopeptide (TPR) repeat protein